MATQMQADYYKNTAFARRSAKMSPKGDQYRKQTANKKGFSETAAVASPTWNHVAEMKGDSGAPRWSQNVAPPPPATHPTSMSQPTAIQASSDVVQVLLHNLPNTLCNTMCMEAMLEQAWLDELVLNIEVQAGSPCGYAKLSFSAWAAGNQCVRHFQGCRWDQTGAPVYAEIYQTPAAAWTSESNVTAEAPAVAAMPAWQEVVESKAEAAPSPTLSATTRATSSPLRSPMGSPLSCKSETPKFIATRKISWADLCSDDEDSTAEETPWSTSGSGGVGASDDGF